jgi:hypothetical protein
MSQQRGGQQFSNDSCPAIPRFSEIFRFVGPDVAANLRELRAEAFAYGFVLALEGALQIEPAFFPKKPPPVPKRAQEILRELFSKHYLRLCEAVNDERRVQGQKPLGDANKLARRQADFEKAYYGKLRHSEKGRRVVDLLRAWHGGHIIAQFTKQPRPDRERIALLTPFLNAVRILDIGFLNLLADAAEMLDTRIRSSKDATMGTGDTDLDLWLLQYGMKIAGTPTHTARELNEQFVSKFRTISDKKLREKCRKVGIPLKEDKRGKAAVRYGRVA